MKEPCVLIPVSDVIELVEAYRELCNRKFKEKVYQPWTLAGSADKFNYYHEQAAKSLIKFNRKTIQDS